MRADSGLRCEGPGAHAEIGGICPVVGTPGCDFVRLTFTAGFCSVEGVGLTKGQADFET